MPSVSRCGENVHWQEHKGSAGKLDHSVRNRIDDKLLGTINLQGHIENIIGLAASIQKAFEYYTIPKLNIFGPFHIPEVVWLCFFIT